MVIGAADFFTLYPSSFIFSLWIQGGRNLMADSLRFAVRRLQKLCCALVASWGTRTNLNSAQFLWVLAMFGVLAGLEANRLGLFLVPPFGATLTILLMIPDAAVAQPWPVVVGSVAGAGIGTLLSLIARGSLMAIVAAVLAFSVINLMRAYHPPGVALAMYPLLLHPGKTFPLLVVLPFTLTAVVTAALLSRCVRSWPPYPRPLRSKP